MPPTHVAIDDSVVSSQEHREQVNDLLVRLFDANPADLAEVSDGDFPLWARAFFAGYDAGLARGAAEARAKILGDTPGGGISSSEAQLLGVLQFSGGGDPDGRTRVQQAMAALGAARPGATITAAQAKALVDQSEKARGNRNFEYDPLLG